MPNIQLELECDSALLEDRYLLIIGFRDGRWPDHASVSARRLSSTHALTLSWSVTSAAGELLLGRGLGFDHSGANMYEAIMSRRK